MAKTMRRPAAVRAVALALLLFLAQALAVPAAAQSILRDAETEAFFRDVARPLKEAAGLEPRAVTIGLVSDTSINAFAMLGQRVYFHAGLIIAAEDVRMFQGVLAHELGHVAGGHAVRWGEGMGPASGISLLSMVLGAAAIAAGAPDAGMAVLMAGQQAAMGMVFAFSREQESRTDQAGAQYLNAAGVDGWGMIEFFRRLQGDEFRLAIPQTNEYARTHPLTGNRIAALEQVLKTSPHWGKGPDPELQARYSRIRGKLIGYISPPEVTLAAYPPSDQSDGARMARAYAFHKSGRHEEALAAIEPLAERGAKDPYALEMKGQILLESGRPDEAIEPLRQAVDAARGEPLIASMLGHALVQSAEQGGADAASHMAEAEAVLRLAIARDRDNPFAWLQLGTIYERRGDQPRAALATAERVSLMGGDPRIANRAARVALAGLPAGTPDHVRAQDIAMASEAEFERFKKQRR
jgi:predicted Zn-dependent protease